MRVLFLGNNRLGVEILRVLEAGGEQVAGLVLHPPQRCRFGDEMKAVCRLPESALFDGSRLRQPEVIAAVREMKAEIAVSALFGYILRPEIIQLFPHGVINIHPALLPYNRGAYPNVWSIVDRTPAGVTIHYIDEGVDTGDIIAQQEVPVEATDTGATLYRRLEQASVDLFRKTWPLVRQGRAPRTPQSAGGTVHRVRDVDAIDRIDLDRTYTARQLIDILRARTYAPYPGAYFCHNGRRIYLRLELISEDRLTEPAGDAGPEGKRR